MRSRDLLPLLALLLEGASGFVPRPTPVLPRLPHKTSLFSVAPQKETAGAEPSETCRTYKILRDLQSDQGSRGAGSSIDVEGLKRLDAAWAAVRNMEPGTGPAPRFVEESDALLPTAPEFDVLVAGGTLGIFVATSLQLKGFKVCVVERGAVAGRTQEWNVSLKELLEFVKLGVLSEEELKDIVGIQFNPIRVGFMGESGPYEFLTEDVLNLGVFPSVLIAKARARFEAAGGVVKERTAVEGAVVSPNGVLLKGPELTARLLIDCMGNGSPITRQVRYGQRPDGVCIVVGTMASGFKPESNTQADLLYTNVPTMDKGARTGVQYFWEAFPASSGPGDRTTYLFHYTDTHPERLSITECFEDYWELLPSYQGLSSIDQLTFKRAVCNFFPTYKDSPLPTRFDRICQIGDASGIQSPLSFGGFASLTRHLPRFSKAFTEALQADCLTKEDLGLINAYTPNLSVTWMFQRSMSVPVGSRPHPFLINRGLINTFKAMEQLGEPVLKPFLQDVVQAGPLARALAGTLVEDPLNLPNILLHVGPNAFFSWFGHYSALVLYTVLHEVLKETKDTELLGGRLRYQWNRLLELFEYGSGMDYVLD